jgi:phospholipid-binding lipoprotein MlaA
MNVAWRFGLLLALAPVGCAHQAGVLAPGGAAGTPGVTSEPGSGAPREKAPGIAAAAATGADESAAEDDFETLDTPAVSIADPLGPWNRAMFTFNDKFYFWLLKPVSRAYRAVVPSFARTGVENFFDNLGAPGRFVSNVLQLKGREASIELGKFMINSTWGVLGFGNLFAGNPETKIPDADLGMSLARYGVGGGPFVVWPFIGPYTLRDSVGWAGGLFLDPVSYIHPFAASLGTRSYYMVNYTSFRIGDYEGLKDASIDPYLAARDAYLQHRAEQVRK